MLIKSETLACAKREKEKETEILKRLTSWISSQAWHLKNIKFDGVG